MRLVCFSRPRRSSNEARTEMPAVFCLHFVVICIIFCTYIYQNRRAIMISSSSRSWGAKRLAASIIAPIWIM